MTGRIVQAQQAEMRRAKGDDDGIEDAQVVALFYANRLRLYRF
jgi:hypothetical protein